MSEKNSYKNRVKALIWHRFGAVATATDANSKPNDAAGSPTSPVVSIGKVFVWPIKTKIQAGKRGENMTIPGIGGRPLKFQSVEELQSGIDKYFADCDSFGIPYTFTGLALALDSTRETLGDYEVKPGYSYPIKQAKERVANYAERSCFTARNPAGAIFLAKNHGFRDRIEVDATTRLTYELPDQVKALTSGEE